MPKKRTSAARRKTAQRRQNRGPDGKWLPGKTGMPPQCQHVGHGLYAMQRAVGELRDTPDWLDSLGPVGEAVRAWQASLMQDLGGDDGISAQQRVVSDLASKTYVLLASVDDWLLRQSPINKRKKSLHPVVRERQQLADSLARYMAQLGLERRQKPVQSLSEYLENRQG